MWRAKACATRRATKLASLLVVVTGNSLFLVELCLFSRRNSLFRCVGNLEEKARNQRVRRGCHVRSPLEIAKFPVIFPVSRELGCRDGFDNDCVRHQFPLFSVTFKHECSRLIHGYRWPIVGPMRLRG